MSSPCRRSCPICGLPARVRNAFGRRRYRRCADGHRLAYSLAADRYLGPVKTYCRGIACPCGLTTRVLWTDGDITHRICADGHRGVWSVSTRRRLRDPITLVDRRAPGSRHPLCDFDGCGKLRAKSDRFCQGHDKQRHRGGPMRPLMSSDPAERLRQIRARAKP